MTLVVNYITNTGRYDGVELPISYENEDDKLVAVISEVLKCYNLTRYSSEICEAFISEEEN